MPAMTNDRTSPPPPSSWSKEVQDLFTPIRRLGDGGFGSVWLARRKKDNTTNIEERCHESDGSEKSLLVAIKVVGHPHNKKISSFEKVSEAGYFKREVSILQEISHPRIVHCLQALEDKDPNSACAPFCMVLEYCRGPTIEQLLKYRGALGISMAQEVSSQLIDVISYLHERAVIHRDIKPDNIIVNGAKFKDEACWSDGVDGNDAAKSMRWRVKLVDFGFARPLRPDDIADKGLLQKKKEPHDDFFGRSTVDNKLDDRSIHMARLGLDLSNSGKGGLDISNSVSRYRVRNLSAVGNRNFAAPEIKKGIRVFKWKGGKHKKSMTDAGPLTECVSDYGMIVDAFSTGATIRYLCTGVPPQTSVEEFIAEKNSCVRVFGRKMRQALKIKGIEPKKRYRSNNDLPSETVRLILGMTHWNEKRRTTVRSARDYEWIASSYYMKEKAEQSPSTNDNGGKLHFLKCALKEQGAESIP